MNWLSIERGIHRRTVYDSMIRPWGIIHEKGAHSREAPGATQLYAEANTGETEDPHRILLVESRSQVVGWWSPI